MILRLILVLTLFCALSVGGWVEPPLYQNVPSMPIKSTTPEPGEIEGYPECDRLCPKNCREIMLKSQLRNEISSAEEMGESCYPFWRCHDSGECFRMKHSRCGQNMILSGFGRSEMNRQRCMPVKLCKQLTRLYLLSNDMHSDITWT